MKLTIDSIRYMTLCENITKARVKDCLEHEDKILFIIEEGYVQKALGKDQEHLKRLERMLKKKIEMIGFNNDPAKFVRNLLYPTKVDMISVEGTKITVSTTDAKTKGRVFGREKTKLKWMNEIVAKYFKDHEIEVR